MTDYKNHKLSEVEKEKITSICTTELLRLYKTDTNLNSRINLYLNKHQDDNSHDTVKHNIIDCYTEWNMSRLHDQDFGASLTFLTLATALAKENKHIEYDSISAYTDEEQYSTPFSTFVHVIILSSWTDWDRLCRDILVYHCSEIINLLKESVKRRYERIELLDALLPKGD